MSHALLLILYGSLILAVVVGLATVTNEPWEPSRALGAAVLSFAVVWGLVVVWFALWMIFQGVWYFMTT